MNEKEEYVRQYEKLASKAPNWYMDAYDLFDVISYYEENGRRFDAEVCLKQALLLHPDDSRLLLKKAEYLKSAGHVKEADEIMANSDDIDGLDLKFYELERALTNFDIRTAEKLLDEIRDEFDQDETDCYVWTEVTEICLDYGFVRLALKAIEKVPEFNNPPVEFLPGQKRAFLLRGECYYQLHDLKNALAWLNKALDIDPYDAAIWGILADIHYETKNFAQAQEACQYALAIDGRNEKALRVSFFCYLMTNDVQNAHKLALEYEKYCPGEYYVPLNDGYMLLSCGYLDAAYQQYCLANAACANENPDKLRIVGEMAQTQLRMNKVDEAFVTLQCACSLGVSYIDVCLQMAQLTASIGKSDYALERLREAVSLGCSEEQEEIVRAIEGQIINKK